MRRMIATALLGAAVIVADASASISFSYSPGQPQVGDVVTVGVDAGAAHSGNLVLFVYGSRLTTDGQSLLDPKVFAAGKADASGAFQHQAAIIPGLEGRRFHLQAFGMRSDGSLWRSNQSQLTVQSAAPSNAQAAFIVTPTTVTITATGQTLPQSSPIEWAYQQSRPGDLILVEPGQHPKFTIDKAWKSGQKMTWIRARTPGATTILKNPTSGSSTINLKNAGYVTIEGFDIEPSDTAAVMCSNKQPVIPSIHFIDCVIDGHYDRYTRTGPKTKWGILGWTLADFVWKGGKIGRIRDEHAFYLHNCEGDVLIEDVEIYHVGRTALQVTARTVDSGVRPNPGKGDITVRNVIAYDCCLADGYAGGSAFTFAGRHRGNILMDRVEYRAGFDAALNQTAGKVVATGAFVSYFGGGSANVNNGPITLSRCQFEIASGGGDRDHIQVAATDSFTMVNCVVTSGKKDAMNISPGSVGSLALDRSNQVKGVCSYGGVNYPNFDLLLDDLGMP